MLNFKEMLEEVVAEVKEEMRVEFETSEDVLGAELATADYHDSIIDNLQGFEHKYMDRNSYRVAHKLRYASEARTADDNEYWNYLLSSQGITDKVESKVTKVTKSYDFNLSTLGLPWVKKNTQPKYTTASVKVKKDEKGKVLEAPKSTYIIENKTVNESALMTYLRKTNQYGKISLVEDNTDTVLVKDFYFFHEMIILEVERTFDINTRIYKREYQVGHAQDEQNFYIVFRYEPRDRYGSPNPNCGLKRLNAILKQTPAVIEAEPKTQIDALRAVVGSTIEIGNYPIYEYSTHTTYAKEVEYKGRDGKVHHKFDKSRTDYDMRTVYVFYGDISYLSSCMTSKGKDNSFLKFEDYNRGKTIKKRKDFEYLPAELYVIGEERRELDDIMNPVKIYGCHKASVEQERFEWDWAHLSQIFD